MAKKHFLQLFLALLTTTMVTACAGSQNGDVADPVEGLNRGIFAFNTCG
jgi:ABC-type transporter lipoprotein component MlaA